MFKRFHFLPVLAISAALAMPANAEEVNADTVVASVNGTEITLGELIVARAQLPQQYQQLPNDVLFTGLVDQLVQQQLLANELEGETPKRLKVAVANELRSLQAAEVVEQMAEEAVTDDTLQAAYQARYADVEPAQEFNAAHILVETEYEAKELITALNEGANFAELAAEKSTGPSGPNGGDLGWFGKGAMVPEFEAAVLELEADEISPPVKTQFGWHVVKLFGVRSQPVPSFEDVRAQLEGDLAQEAVQAKLAELETGAQVERTTTEGWDLSVLNKLDLLKD